LIATIKRFKDIVSLVCVGNEPLGSWYHGVFNNLLFKACDNVRLALGVAGLNDIGVTVPQNFEFMAASYPPSAGAVKPELVDIIKNTCSTMSATKAPFMVNIYPFITYIQNRNVVPLPYCLWNAAQNQWVKDGNYTYKNIFDAMLDALHVALGKIGFPNLEIIVGECGWPTGGGDQDATIANAQTFNQGLINHCKSSQGTPRYPGKPIQCFVFEMYDEDQKPVDAGQFERHWGCYDVNAGAKYKLNW
jgi:glycosyl hydrolase family 17